MAVISVDSDGLHPVEIYYEDHGTGKPVVLIHGWPLSGASWEKQVTALLAAGYRVITYDRRGFGRSDMSADRYDCDTLAADLRALLTKLVLRDVALVGFSMGTGEIARYLGRYGSRGVSKVAFIGSIPPFLPKSDDNPTGYDPAVIDDMRRAILADRAAFLISYLNTVYNIDEPGEKLVSDALMRSDWNIAVDASPIATYHTLSSLSTDFRPDLAAIDIPAIVIHGDRDRIMPIEATAIPLAAGVRGARLVVIEGGPHGVIRTHAERVNRELTAFLR